MEELLTAKTPPLLTLTLNRPSRKNALTGTLVALLTEALEAADEDPDLRAIVLTGAGDAFCAGADLDGIVQVPPEARATALDGFQRLIVAIARSRLPVIAQIHGPAAGFGADLALSCDLRVASTKAFVQESFVHVGLMPDGGSTHTLPALVGYGRAFEMLALGERFDAAELRQMGLVTEVVPVEILEETTRALADRLARAPALSVARIKRALRASSDESLERALAREKEGQLELLASDDFAEGVRAFREKRAPTFRGS